MNLLVILVFGIFSWAHNQRCYLKISIFLGQKLQTYLTHITVLWPFVNNVSNFQ